MTGKEEWKMLS